MTSGTLYEISKFATHDGPGIRTVLFLKGCPLRCIWCHSPESWSYSIQKWPNGETVGMRMTSARAADIALEDRDFYEASGGGVTLSGGEVLAQPGFAREILEKVRAANVHTAVETSGYAPFSAVESLLPHVSLWLWDVKELDAAKHAKYTGRPLKPILDNLREADRRLAASGEGKDRIILRCPMIPGLNDGDAEISAIAKLADSLSCVRQIDVIPYIPYGIDKAKRLGLKVYEAPPPPPEYAPAVAAKLAKLSSRPVNLP